MGWKEGQIVKRGLEFIPPFFVETSVLEAL
jgi:hypothetical protein